jgi:hypothetical protein
MLKNFVRVAQHIGQPFASLIKARLGFSLVRVFGISLFDIQERAMTLERDKG